MMKKEQICSHIIRLMHAPIRIYSQSGEKLAVYIDHGEQQDVIECDEELRLMLLKKSKTDYPVLYLEAEQIIYGIVSDGGETFLLGPCCLGNASREAAGYLIRKHNMDTQKPYRLYCITLEAFCELVIMLFETITDRTTTRDEVLHKCFCDEKLIYAMNGKVHEVFSYLRENSAVHNPYSQEMREQEAIRRGDLEALKSSFQESYVGELGTLSRNPIRQAQNLAIVLITLACRSAITGGMLPEVAFSMSDAFIQHAEELRNEGEILAFARQAEIEYCKAVHELTFHQKQSPLVTRCKALIVQQLHSKLTVQDLAGQLEITAGYLSHLFLKEEGVKLAEYITREKIEFAKKELVYTNQPYDKIAYSLGFVSQSHFGQSFKKVTGMTPGQYRESYGGNLNA